MSGSGLGLAICKHIIEAHGQTIHVCSRPDVGMTIGFTLEEEGLRGIKNYEWGNGENTRDILTRDMNMCTIASSMLKI